MGNLAFIVEGHTEKLFLENACPNSPVRFIGVNGNDVELSAIASRVLTQINLLRKRADHFIIIFDRENRTKTCDDLENELSTFLKQAGVLANEFSIGIPDRTIENWILSDCTNVKESGSDQSFEYTQEGKKCIRLIKEKYPKFHKTNTAPNLLKANYPERMKKNSASFAKFLDMLLENNVSCWWMEKTA